MPRPAASIPRMEIQIPCFQPTTKSIVHDSGRQDSIGPEKEPTMHCQIIIVRFQSKMVVNRGLLWNGARIDGPRKMSARQVRIEGESNSGKHESHDSWLDLVHWTRLFSGLSLYSLHSPLGPRSTALLWPIYSQYHSRRLIRLKSRKLQEPTYQIKEAPTLTSLREISNHGKILERME